MPHQDAMAALSTNSLHDVVPGATHQSLVDNPTHAAVGREIVARRIPEESRREDQIALSGGIRQQVVRIDQFAAGRT